MTTTTLRPNTLIASADVSVVVAASLVAATSDDLDTTWAETDAGPGTKILILGMTTLSLPSGAVTKSVGAVMRWNADNAGQTTFRCGLFSTVFTDLIAVNFNGTGALDPPIDSSLAPIAVTLSQAQVDSLATKVDTTIPEHKYREFYVNLTYVTIPVTVVTAVTPDPYTASNIVPIAWTNTLDVDGGVQTRYQIRVFTAAQYGIGGFDPATSPATQDTGEVLGGALTRNTLALANSTTYRAYVRVAQTVNGVSHWSAYAFDQFAVSVTTSDIDTVTTAAVNASARIDITVNRDTGSSAWNFVEVQRSTDAGATWSPVRGATYVDATSNANTFTASDYETANGQATLYRARATRIVSLLPITGAFVQSTPAVSWTSESAWLKSPANPTLNSPVLVAGPIESSTIVDRGVFYVLGLAAPVVVSDVRRLTVGRITFQTESDAAIAVLRALLDDSELLFQAPANWSVSAMYISIGDVGRERGPMEGFPVTRWPSSYVEIATPRDPLASAP